MMKVDRWDTIGTLCVAQKEDIEKTKLCTCS